MGARIVPNRDKDDAVTTERPRPGRVIGLLAASVALLTSGPAVAAFQYSVTDLGVLSGGDQSTSAGINSLGRVVATGTIGSGDFRAAVGGPSPGLESLGVLAGGRSSFGRAINDSGVVAGTSEIQTGPGKFANRAFRAMPGQGLQDLGVLPGGLSSEAVGIDAIGRVAGFSTFLAGNTHAFFSDEGLTLRDLGTLGGANSRAGGVSRSGIVVGTSETATGALHAFRSVGGGPLEDLGTLDGGTSSSGFAVNDSGQVAGSATNNVGRTRAVRSRIGGGFQDLGVLPSGFESFATSINSRGDVVGQTNFIGGNSGAFVFIDGRGLIDLNSAIDPRSGVSITGASAINDAGMIAATGIVRGQYHALLLSPVSTPEPTSALMAATGGLILLACSRLHRSKGRQGPA